jgi:hypothetical protein
MSPLFRELRIKKSRLISLNLVQVISIAGALLVVIAILAGFYQLAAIVAGADLIVTRFALGVMSKAKPGSLGSGR